MEVVLAVRKKSQKEEIKKVRQDEVLKVRYSEELKNKTIIRAKMYAGGDVSKWVRHCLDNYEPKVIK